MDTAELSVTILGLALIAFTLWFFFGKRPAVAARRSDGGAQEIEILVKGGYSPDRIEVERGRPVRLKFFRDETTPCTEQVILGAFGLARDLPHGKTTVIEFTPDKAGEFVFHCGMNMVRGTIIVNEPANG